MWRFLGFRCSSLNGEDAGYEIPPEWTAEESAEEVPDNAGDLFAGEGASLGEEGLPIPEQEVEGLDPNWGQRARAWNEKWEETISQLKDPVEIVPLVFVEPVASKRASVTLRAIQRVYTRIRLLNLGVRRLHAETEENSQIPC